MAIAQKRKIYFRIGLTLAKLCINIFDANHFIGARIRNLGRSLAGINIAPVVRKGARCNVRIFDLEFVSQKIKARAYRREQHTSYCRENVNLTSGKSIAPSKRSLDPSPTKISKNEGQEA